MAGDTSSRNQNIGSKGGPLVLPTTSANLPPQLPPSISLKSRILLSRISLPNSPNITYRAFGLVQHHNDPDLLLECARRQIVQTWDPMDDDISQSFLVKVVLQQLPTLWIFRIVSQSGNSERFQMIDELEFEGLKEVDRGCFHSKDLQPCSSHCSQEQESCANCYSGTSNDSGTHISPDHPRNPLRRPHAIFLDALRDRITDVVCQATHKARQEDEACTHSRTVAKLGNGLILWPKPNLTSEWSVGWENEANQRPMIHCYLHIHLSKSEIIVQPLLRSTSFFPLPRKIFPGSAVALLPTCSFAYYLSDYAGQTDYLSSAFSDSLLGLGVTDWSKEGYAFCWISAKSEGKLCEDDDDVAQGKESGVVIVWPKQLCLLCADRPCLEALPTLPGPISPCSESKVDSRLKRLVPKKTSLNAFKALSLESRLTRHVAEVADYTNGYVDAVLKDRERLRDSQRLDRLREKSGGSSEVTRPPLAPSPVIHNSPVEMDLDASRQFYPSPPDLNNNGQPDQFSFLQIPPTFPTEYSPLQQPTSLASSSHQYATIQSSATQPTVDWSGMMFPPETKDSVGVVGSSDAFDSLAMVTDDDFSFFDEPAVPISVANSVPFSASISTSLAPAVVPISAPVPAPPPISFHFDDDADMFASLTKHFGPLEPSLLRKETEIPSSPQRLPLSPASSASPSRPTNITDTRSTVPEASRGMFDPLPIKQSHVLAQYSLPSPEAEGDDSDDDQPTRGASFQIHYDNLTNPSHDLVRRLRGHKRKRKRDSPFTRQQLGRKEPRLWNHVSESNSPVRCWDADYSDSDAESAESVTEEEEGNVGVYEYDTDEVQDESRPSRTNTPPPAFLTPGIRLLHGQFLDERVISLSGPLRSSITEDRGDVLVSVQTPPPPVSVPTPVSPAAVSGGSGDNTMSRNVVSVALREMVENPLWAAACMAESNRDTNVGNEQLSEWQEDAICLMHLLDCPPLTKAENLYDLSSIWAEIADVGADTSETKPLLEQLHAPSFTIAQRDAVLQVSPPALRFWEKLGLGPLSGPKDVVAFALFEDEDGDVSPYVGRWLENMGRVYSERGFGLHTLGITEGVAQGLVPLRWQAFRKTLGTILSLFPTSPHIVFYVLVSPSFARYASQPFCQLTSIIMQAAKLPVVGDVDNDRILFHFVPRRLVLGGQFPSTRYGGLEHVARAVYDRLPRRVERLIPRRVFAHDALPLQTLIDAPSFTLSRPMSPTFKFVMDWPAATIAGIDRYTFLHIAYKASPCGRWLFASCVDQRGQDHLSKVWLLSQIEGDELSSEQKIVETVLDFALDFSHRANLEWRLVFARFGIMSNAELEAWESVVAPRIISNPSPIHVSLVCVEQDTSFTFLPPLVADEASKSGAGGAPDTKFADTTSRTYLFIPPSHHRTHTLASDFSSNTFHSDYTHTGLIPLSTVHLIHSLCSTPPNDSSPFTIRTTQIHLLRTCHSTLATFDQPNRRLIIDIAKNFHELAVLCRERWTLTAQNTLPLHLAVVDSMASVLARGHILKEGSEV